MDTRLFSKKDFIEQIKNMIGRIGKTEEDVLFIGVAENIEPNGTLTANDTLLSWEEFVKLEDLNKIQVYIEKCFIEGDGWLVENNEGVMRIEENSISKIGTALKQFNVTLKDVRLLGNGQGHSLFSIDSVRESVNNSSVPERFKEFEIAVGDDWVAYLKDNKFYKIPAAILKTWKDSNKSSQFVSPAIRVWNSRHKTGEGVMGSWEDIKVKGNPTLIKSTQSFGAKIVSFFKKIVNKK